MHPYLLHSRLRIRFLIFMRSVKCILWHKHFVPVRIIITSSETLRFYYRYWADRTWRLRRWFGCATRKPNRRPTPVQAMRSWFDSRVTPATAVGDSVPATILYLQVGVLLSVVVLVRSFYVLNVEAEKQRCLLEDSLSLSWRNVCLRIAICIQIQIRYFYCATYTNSDQWRINNSQIS